MTKTKTTGFIVVALILVAGILAIYETTQKGSFYQQLTPQQKEIANGVTKMIVNPLNSIPFLSNLISTPTQQKD